MYEKVHIEGVIGDDGKETVTVDVDADTALEAATIYVDTLDHIIAQRKKQEES